MTARRARGPVAAAALLAACGAPPAADEPAPTFLVAPYVWLPSQTGDVPDDEGEDTDVDLVGLDDLDAALMLAFEARSPGSRWGLLADSVYVRFDNEDDVVGVETGIQMIEVAAAYAPGDRSGVELLAGLRFWRLWADFDLLSVVSRLQEETWIDPVLGVRATRALSPRWTLSGRADVGGFGVEADWIYQMRADLRYALGPSWAAELGYRYLSVDSSNAGFDFVLAGPSLGLRWGF